MKQVFNKYPWIIVVIIIGIYLILRRFGIMPDILAKSENEKEEDHKVNESKLSYEKSQYKTWANMLQGYMDTDDWTNPTDEEGIFHIYYKMQTDDDVKELNNAFGSRPYTGDPYDIFSQGDEYTLGGWFAKELDDDEMKKLNLILKNRNIKFRY